MTNNEKIAKWLGWTKHKQPNFMYMWNKPGETGERNLLYGPPSFDKDIALWRDGKEGLFYKIGSSHLAEKFIDALFNQCEYTDDRKSDDWEWYLASACPAQLSAALVAVIEEDPK